MNNNYELKMVNEVGTAYTFYLEAKTKQLYGMMVNDNVSVEDMQRNIRNYIWNAAYKTADGHYTKKKYFLDKVNEMADKKEIYWFCINSINKAHETIAR